MLVLKRLSLTGVLPFFCLLVACDAINLASDSGWRALQATDRLTGRQVQYAVRTVGLETGKAELRSECSEDGAVLTAAFFGRSERDSPTIRVNQSSDLVERALASTLSLAGIGEQTTYLRASVRSDSTAEIPAQLTHANALKISMNAQQLRMLLASNDLDFLRVEVPLLYPNGANAPIEKGEIIDFEIASTVLRDFLQTCLPAAAPPGHLPAVAVAPESNHTQAQMGPEQSVGYLLPQSDHRLLNAGDIAGLSVEQLRLARNEIFARHGRIFADRELATHFGQFEWYRPTQHEVRLSPVEASNVQFLQAAEAERR